MDQTEKFLEEMEKLDNEEIDEVAGGIVWGHDDASDGHELFCTLTYHHLEWSREHNEWCTKIYHKSDPYN